MLAATEIDLVFAEDGVAAEDLEAALERVFDIFDVLGPGPIQEKHFAGILRVRVIVHDFTLGNPFKREGYSEPSYSEIGRARILHVMKDRGEGDRDKDPIPVTPEQQPFFAPTAQPRGFLRTSVH